MYKLTTNFRVSHISRVPTLDEITQYYIKCYQAGIKTKDIKFEVKDVRPTFVSVTEAIQVESVSVEG